MDAMHRYPGQEDREFQKARIEVVQHRDVRCLGEYFRGVWRLTSFYVPEMEEMHTIYDYNE
jgi:hypothetical protein